MRGLVVAVLVAVALVPPGRLRGAPAEAAPPSVLVVGQPVAFRPPALPVSVICDDTSIIRVEDAGTFLRLTGLRAGTTTCSFGSPLQPGRRQLQRFEVREP
jgi:hypothetical protein